MDIFIFLVNSNGGITENTKTEIEMFKKIDRPLLIVLNKIDTIDPVEREVFIWHQFKGVGQHKDFIPAAFDPILSIEPINVNKVHDWINKTVNEKGSQLLAKKRSAITY